MGMNNEAEDMEVAAGKRAREADDWRSHTCGECGWAYCWDYNGKNWFTCRHVSWMNQEDVVESSIPSCPAFVAREVKS